MNAASRDINRLAYISAVVVTISLGGSCWTGGMARVSFRVVDGLRVRRMARRRAADCSPGSGSSFEWILVTKVELTAENRPAYEKGQMAPENAF